MFSISQSARPRSLDHSQEGHSLTIRIKCPCHVYPGHRFMLRMSEERRRRVYAPWTPRHSSSRVLGNKGFLRRLVRGWSSLMAIPTLHSSRQWAISKKPANSLPLTPSIYFNTQQDPWCGKIRFLGLFNICFWQLQCVLFSLQKAAGELSRHFIFLRPNKIHNGFWEIICDFTQKKKELKERLSPSPHKRFSSMLAWG